MATYEKCKCLPLREAGGNFVHAFCDFGRSLTGCFGRAGKVHPVITSFVLGVAVFTLFGHHEMSWLLLAVNYEKLYGVLFGE
jgi:hypothetical protein